MYRIRILTVMLLGALVVAVAGSTAASQKLKGTLVGTVGPGYTITLKQNGTSVKNNTLKAGTYKITVKDKGTIHNFHLFGPGVNKKTSVSGTGTFVWTVTFKKGGNYTYRCDIHYMLGMIGHFKVN
ncbi:MAG: plastocyanin/azurin family copper-binding protein [Gaiellaceae bacterium]|jgi:plastocyanin